MLGKILSVLGAIGIVMIETSVESAKTNISGWLDYLLRFPIYAIIVFGLYLLSKGKLKDNNSKTKNATSTFIDNSVLSYSQIGGITARNVNVGNTQRRMTNELSSKLLELLDVKKDVDISVAMNDPEAECYANEIKYFLLRNNYRMAYETMLYESMAGGRGIVYLDTDDDINYITIGPNVNVSDKINFLGSASRPAV